jgi:hypothetical protein
MTLYQLHSNPEELHHYHEAHEKIPAVIWEKYKKDPKELKKFEHILATDGKYAYYYAVFVLNAPFQLGEAAISKDPDYAGRYALNILKLSRIEARNWKP